MSSKSIHIVIPTHNRWGRLECLLKQVEEQSHHNKIKVVVVADGCTDETLISLPKEFPNVEIVKGDGSWWFTKSLNEGLKIALNSMPDFILTLNDDVELKSDYFDQLLNAIELINEKCLMGSISYGIEEPHLLTFSGVKKIIKWRLKQQLYHKFYSKNLYGSLTGTHESVLLPTRGLLIPTQLFVDGLFFDESLPQYGSDYDFVLKSRKMGYGTFISWDAVIFEYTMLTGQGSPLLKESFYKFHKNLFNKYAKNYFINDLKMIWRHYLTPLLPITLLVYIAGLYWTYFKYFFLKK